MNAVVASTQTLRNTAALGYGGLIPFVVLALAPLIEARWTVLAGHALTVYTVAVLSFIGAMAWGVALVCPNLTPAHRRGLLLWGVAPSLLASLAALAPLPDRYLLFVATLWLAWWAERRLFPHQALPVDWPKLRVRLSVGVTACLLVAWHWQGASLQATTQQGVAPKPEAAKLGALTQGPGHARRALVA